MTQGTLDKQDMLRLQTVEQQYGHLLGIVFLCLEKYGTTDEDGTMEIVFPPEMVPADRDLPTGTLRWGYIPEEFQGVGAKMRVWWEKGEEGKGE